MTLKDPLVVIAESLAAARKARAAHASAQRDLFCYVALGDSFTAGKGCAAGESWADRLAASLRAVHSPLGYYNLAVDGGTSAHVLDHQVGPALQLEPDLVTVICGANDVLTSVRPDIDGYAARLTTILDRLREGSPRAALLTATSPEHWRFLELRPRTRARVVGGIGRLNEATRAVASSRGVPCLDVANHPGLHDRANFAPDGLHPSPAGHARAAIEFARALHLHFGIEGVTTATEKEER
jgi:lysophospholipase L1-like esterase